MSRPPIGDVVGKKQHIEQMFDDIAPRYDLANRILSLGIDQGWRRKTIAKVYEQQPRQILDVATGTGDLAIQAAESGDATITGVDISHEMLQVARRKIKQKGLDGRVAVESGDAQSLRFPDGSFDCIMVAFGVRNFENLNGGLKEMRRVLRPGGRLVILEFSRPRSFPMKQAVGFYNHQILPRVGGMLTGNQGAYTYLPDSVDAFPEGEEMINRMKGVGYESIEEVRLTFGIASIYVGHNR